MLSFTLFYFMRSYITFCLFVRPSVRLFVRPSVPLFVHPSVGLSVSPSVRLFIRQSVGLSVSVCPPVCPYAVCLSVSSFAFPLVVLSGMYM